MFQNFSENMFLLINFIILGKKHSKILKYGHNFINFDQTHIKCMSLVMSDLTFVQFFKVKQTFSIKKGK
jgi:hypothetical protein